MKILRVEMEDLKADIYNNLDHLVATVRRLFREVIAERELAPASLELAERRIAKVERYVAHSAPDA